MPGPARNPEVIYTYHEATEAQSAKYRAIRQFAKELDQVLTDLCPESRERSLAFTKLDEVVMWANAAIARNT